MKDVLLIKEKKGRFVLNIKDCIRQKKKYPKSTTQKYFLHV